MKTNIVITLIVAFAAMVLVALKAPNIFGYFVVTTAGIMFVVWVTAATFATLTGIDVVKYLFSKGKKETATK